MKKRYLFLTAALLCAGAAMANDYSDNFLPTQDQNVVLDETNLPIVFINLNGQQMNNKDADTYVLARMKVIDNGKGQLNHGDTIAYPAQTVDYEGFIAIKYRGNSSFSASDKKPYAFRTLKTDVLPDDGGSKDKVKILGMGKDNKWAFIAPWCDRSMFRDILSFELGRPWFDYTPTAKLCEVIVDGTYYGVYALTERVSKGKKRLNLNDPGENDGDLTGDFLVRIDRGWDPHYTSKYRPWSDKQGSVEQNHEIVYEYKHPDEEDMEELPEGTKEAIHAAIDQMEDAFAASNWQDPNEGYRKYIDVTSFIDYMLSQEVSMNIDGYRLSTYLYKYSDTRAEVDGLDARWKMSIWDYNIAWGLANYYNGESTDKWQYDFNLTQGNWGDSQQLPFYWYKLLQDDSYKEELKARWAAYREGNHSTERITALVDSLANELTSHGAADRNEQAWGILTRSYIWPSSYYPRTYADEIAQLKSWIGKRVAFMDKQLLGITPDARTQPVGVSSGWNADIIAEGPRVNNYVSTSLGGYVYYSADARSDGGLPADGSITSAQDEGISYQLQSYSGNNAVILNGDGESATVAFTEPFNTSELFMLGTSANGTSTIEVTLHYTDGSYSTPTTLSISDWVQGGGAVNNLGRAGQNDDLNGWRFRPDTRFTLYDLSVAADPTRNIQSLTITSRSGALPAIFAFSKTMVTATAIDAPAARDASASRSLIGIYSLSGMKLDAPQRGVNIFRYSDGTTRKAMVK